MLTRSQSNSAATKPCETRQGPALVAVTDFIALHHEFSCMTNTLRPRLEDLHVYYVTYHNASETQSMRHIQSAFNQWGCETHVTELDWWLAIAQQGLMLITMLNFIPTDIYKSQITTLRCCVADIMCVFIMEVCRAKCHCGLQSFHCELST